jgi:hypothetical protein
MKERLWMSLVVLTILLYVALVALFVRTLAMAA